MLEKGDTVIAAVSSIPPSSAERSGLNSQPAGRKRFRVELTDSVYEVSWKELLNSGRDEAAPAAAAAPPPPKGAPKKNQNQLNAVIKKIERLYKGCDNDDEDEDAPVAVPTDEQYNSDDSFIDDDELDDYCEVDRSVTKHNGYFINKGEIEKIDETNQVSVSRKRRIPNGVQHNSKLPKVDAPIKDQSSSKVPKADALVVVKVPSTGTKITDQNKSTEQRTGNGYLKRKDPNTAICIRDCPADIKEISPCKKLKLTVLERAMQELEKGVSELCPATSDIEGSKANRRTLPKEVKTKLAKAARLAQAKEGKISDEFVTRLMHILGHMMQLKTLKRNVKEMVDLGLSAKQEKDLRLQNIRHEVTEMVKARIQQPNGQQAVGGEGRYQWDPATEDRLCDLYEQFIEGMDESIGPTTRKFYADLTEIWPGGWMDTNGIKHAIARAKERRKKANKVVRVSDSKKRRLSTSPTRQITTTSTTTTTAAAAPATVTVATTAAAAAVAKAPPPPPPPQPAAVTVATSTTSAEAAVSPAAAAPAAVTVATTTAAATAVAPASAAATANRHVMGRIIPASGNGDVFKASSTDATNV